MTTKNSKKGFTLVELVVVIAILAILAAIAIPVVNSIINTAARNSAISNADSIELQIKNCQADIAARNTERYPNAVTAPNTISVDDVATNVAAISEEQAASTDEILETSKQMVEQANSITQHSHEVADNSQELAKTSEMLTSYVNQFKI